MALLPIDDLHGLTAHPRVDILALRHRAAAVLIQVDMDPHVRCYDLPKVGVSP
jgi:hypothetical protein